MKTRSWGENQSNARRDNNDETYHFVNGGPPVLLGEGFLVTTNIYPGVLNEDLVRNAFWGAGENSGGWAVTTGDVRLLELTQVGSKILVTGSKHHCGDKGKKPKSDAGHCTYNSRLSSPSRRGDVGIRNNQGRRTRGSCDSTG